MGILLLKGRFKTEGNLVKYLLIYFYYQTDLLIHDKARDSESIGAEGTAD